MSGPDIGGHRRAFRANRRPPPCARPASAVSVRLRCCRRGAHPGAIEARRVRAQLDFAPAPARVAPAKAVEDATVPRRSLSAGLGTVPIVPLLLGVAPKP